MLEHTWSIPGAYLEHDPELIDASGPRLRPSPPERQLSTAVQGSGCP